MTPLEAAETIIAGFPPGPVPGTHSPTCWRFHFGCFAVLIRDLELELSPEEQAIVDRFGIFDQEQD